MAIRPTKFNPDGSIEVWHDEFQHGGTVSAAGVQFSRQLDGSPDLRYIRLDCPGAGCDSHSVHPASGGCDPELVQRLFAHKLKRDVPGRTWDEAKAILKPLVIAMDGPERWRLEDVAETD